MTTSRHRVYGVDFSGARDAGEKIWIASGVVEADTLRIDACQQASDLPRSGKHRDQCLRALRDFIANETDAAFGLDFPFGLPRTLVRHPRWEDFVLSFPENYADPDVFRQISRQASKGHELKRVTDEESRTPFSPYNLRLYRQTYYGIRDLLYPLVRDRAACVLPMQEPLPHKPWLLEICPASTLKREKLYRPYKGRDEGRRAARRHILETLEGKGTLLIPDQVTRSVLLENQGGDALDSVVAALATFRALGDVASLTVKGVVAYALEGYVYV